MPLILAVVTILIITSIIVEQKIFLFWRELLEENMHKGFFYEKIYELFSCFFCMSVWITFAIMLLLEKRFDIQYACLYIFITNAIRNIMIRLNIYF